MTSVSVNELTKNYIIRENTKGYTGWLRDIISPKTRIKKAVDSISFEIAQGEVVGFLGPNGAGKTTTLKILSGLLYPTAGDVKVLGHVPQHRKREFLRSISFVAGQRQQLIWDLPAADTFRLNQKIYGVSDERFNQVLGFLDELLGVGELAKAPVRTLSLGEKMKCELTAALLHDPKILFLDEPTVGLDVEVQLVVRDFIKEYASARKATVLLTSHYMQDVEALCERVIVISDGSLVFDDTLDGLCRQASDQKTISVQVSEATSPADLESFGTAEAVGSNRFQFVVPASETVSFCSNLLNNLAVVDVSISDPPIEQALMTLFRTQDRQISNVKNVDGVREKVV